MDAFNDIDVARVVDKKEMAIDDQFETKHICSVHMVLLFSTKKITAVCLLVREKKKNRQQQKYEKKKH